MAFKYCYVNLNIGDFLKCKVDTNTTGNFVYGINSFDRVELFGIVVSVREYDERNVYQIDDCTGVVACHEFKTVSKTTAAVQRYGNEEELLPANINSNTLESSMTNLEEIADRFENSKLDQRGPFKLGDFVQIRGQLKEYEGVRRVWVHFLKMLDDPNWETFYMSRQLELYKKVYDRKIDKEDV